MEKKDLYGLLLACSGTIDNQRWLVEQMLPHLPQTVDKTVFKKYLEHTSKRSIATIVLAATENQVNPNCFKRIHGFTNPEELKAILKEAQLFHQNFSGNNTYYMYDAVLKSKVVRELETPPPALGLTPPPETPGAYFKRCYMEPRKLGVTAAAKCLGISRRSLTKFINGDSACTPTMAARLSIATDLSAREWMRKQTAVDIWKAEHTILLKPVKPLPTTTDK